MSRKIDHDRRRREIAEKAIRLFSQVGYDNVSLIMIAAATGISRTVLYRYFCSKREVLDAAIMTILSDIEERCRAAIIGSGATTTKLEHVCHEVIEVMFRNKEFLVAVFDFVIAMVRTGADMNGRIAEFTAGTRGAVRLLLRHGVRRGEIAEQAASERFADVIYSEFESTAMRIVLGTERTPNEAKERFTEILATLSRQPPTRTERK